MVDNIQNFGSILYMKLNCKNMIDDYYLQNNSIRFYQDESLDTDYSKSVDKNNPDKEIEILESSNEAPAYRPEVKVLNRPKTSDNGWRYTQKTSNERLKKKLKLDAVEQKSFDRGVKGCRINCLIDSMQQRERAGYSNSREARIESNRNLKLIRCLEGAGNRTSEEDCFMVHVIFRARQLEHLRLATDRKRRRSRGTVADKYFDKYKVRDKYTPATTKATTPTTPNVVAVTEKIQIKERGPWTHEAFQDRGPWEPIYENECKFRCEEHWIRLYVEMSKEVGSDSKKWTMTTTTATISKESTDDDFFANVVWTDNDWTSKSSSGEKSTNDGLEENVIEDGSGEYDLSNESKWNSLSYDHGSQDERGSEERRLDKSHRKKDENESLRKKDKHKRKHGKSKTTTTEQTNFKIKDYDDDHLGYDRSDSNSYDTELETTRRNDVQSTTEGKYWWWPKSSEDKSDDDEKSTTTTTTRKNDVPSTTEGKNWWDIGWFNSGSGNTEKSLEENSDDKSNREDGDDGKSSEDKSAKGSSSQNSKLGSDHSGNSVEVNDSKETTRNYNYIESDETSRNHRKNKKKENRKNSDRSRAESHERITSTDVTTQATTTEEYSESSCLDPEQHLCGDGMCVDYENVCDHKYDCEDQTDEHDCQFYFNNLEMYDYGLDGDEIPTKSDHAKQESTTSDLHSTTVISTTTENNDPQTVTEKRYPWSLDYWWKTGASSNSMEDKSDEQTTKRPATITEKSSFGSDESEKELSSGTSSKQTVTTEESDSRWWWMRSKESTSTEKVNNEIPKESDDEWMNSALRVTAGPTSTVSDYTLTTTTNEPTTGSYATTRKRPDERLKENYNAYNFTCNEGNDNLRNCGRARRPSYMDIERERMKLIRNRIQEEEQRRMREEQERYRMRDEIERRKWEMQRQSHELLEKMKRINYDASRRNGYNQRRPSPDRTHDNERGRLIQGRPTTDSNKELQM